MSPHCQLTGLKDYGPLLCERSFVFRKAEDRRGHSNAVPLRVLANGLVDSFRYGCGELTVGGDEELIGVFCKEHGVGAVDWVRGFWAWASAKRIEKSTILAGFDRLHRVKCLCVWQEESFEVALIGQEHCGTLLAPEDVDHCGLTHTLNDEAVDLEGSREIERVGVDGIIRFQDRE